LFKKKKKKKKTKHWAMNVFGTIAFHSSM